MTEFVNSTENAKKYPDTWHDPSPDRKARLGKGDTVKIGVPGEKFWAEIVEKTEAGFRVRVDNDLIMTDRHGLKYNDVVEITAENVCDIYD